MSEYRTIAYALWLALGNDEGTLRFEQHRERYEKALEAIGVDPSRVVVS